MLIVQFILLMYDTDGVTDWLLQTARERVVFMLYDSYRDGDNPVDLSIRFLFMLLITVLIAWASWVKPRGALLNAGGSRVGEF